MITSSSYRHRLYKANKLPIWNTKNWLSWSRFSKACNLKLESVISRCSCAKDGKEIKVYNANAELFSSFALTLFCLATFSSAAIAVVVCLRSILYVWLRGVVAERLINAPEPGHLTLTVPLSLSTQVNKWETANYDSNAKGENKWMRGRGRGGAEGRGLNLRWTSNQRSGCSFALSSFLLWRPSW